MKPPLQFLLIIMDIVFGCKTDDHEGVSNYQPAVQIAHHDVLPEVECGTIVEEQHSSPWHVYVKTAKADGVMPNECSAVLIPVKDNKRESDILLTSYNCIKGDYTLGTLKHINALHAISIEFQNRNIKYFASAGIRGKWDRGERNAVIGVGEIFFRSSNEYRKEFSLFEMAVLKLRSPMPFSRKVRPICRGRGLDTPTHCVVTIFGKGFTGDLRDKPVTVTTAEECRRKTKLNHIIRNHDEVMMCAQVDTKSSDIDNKASLGAAVACKDQVSQKWNLLGIVWAIAMSSPPSVLSTRAPHYYDWIENLANALTAVN